MSMSADADPDRLDAQDWRWLRANDLNRRSQRRRFDGDNRSSVRDSKETPERHPGGEKAVFQEADAEKDVREPSQGALQIREWFEPSKEDEEDLTQDALDFGLLDEDVAYVGIDGDVPDFDWQDFAGMRMSSTNPRLGGSTRMKSALRAEYPAASGRSRRRLSWACDMGGTAPESGC